MEIGAKYYGRNMLLFVAKVDKNPKVGISVGKRIGNAVKRNRAKRIMREIVRLSKHRIAPGFGIVIVPRATVILNSFAASMLEFEDILRRAGCFFE